MRWLALALLLTLGCRADAVNAMSKTTRLADEQYSSAFTQAADICLRKSDTREAYDTCLAPWLVGADSVSALRATTLGLDIDHGKKAFRSASCRWLDALRVLDTLSPAPLPAVKAGLTSRYTRRCGK